MRRPLVVYAARSELGVDSIDGLYLPDLWSTAAVAGHLGSTVAACSAAAAGTTHAAAANAAGSIGIEAAPPAPMACSRTPLALAYTGTGSSGHFTACVSFDGFEHALPLTHHIDCTRLPLRFGPASLLDSDAPGYMQSWEEIVGAHTDLGWWEHGGARYPLAYVSRGPCDPGALMLPAVEAMRARFLAKAAVAAAEEAAATAAPLPPLPSPPSGWHALEVALRRTEGAGFGLDITDDNEICGVLPGSCCDGVLQPDDRVVALDGRLLKSSLIEDIMSGNMVKVPPWQCPSSPPVPPQRVPGGFVRLGTPGMRPCQWAPNHRLGGSSELPPKFPISLPLTVLLGPGRSGASIRSPCSAARSPPRAPTPTPTPTCGP